MRVVRHGRVTEARCNGMTTGTYLFYVAACLGLLVVPGPMVSLIIGNSLTYGTRAGLLNLAGSQLGQMAMLAVLLLGLETVVTVMGAWFDWVRLAGAAYLVWLGLNMIFSREQAGALGAGAARPAGQGFFWQGLGVALSNPKLLLFFGAFIPQFVDTTQPATPQVLRLTLTFMVLAMMVDGGYAVLAGQAGRWVAGPRRRLMSRISGLLLMGGGVWLALLRR